MTRARLFLVWAVAISLGAPVAVQAAPVPITFVVNDSAVKDKVLPDVAVAVVATLDGPKVATGTTDAAGRFTAELDPGSYFVTFEAKEYIQLEATGFDVGKNPQTITATLIKRMKASAAPGRRRVQIVLNWGADEKTQVRDMDAHLLCACKSDSGHVYFGRKSHTGRGHDLNLDVDDMDWGGPETITLLDGPPGTYAYWVYDYSTDSGVTLGASDVVVRVVAGDEQLGEYRIPRDVTGRHWRPFKNVTLDEQGRATVVLFAKAEKDDGADRAPPPASDWPAGLNAEGETCDDSCHCGVTFPGFVLAVVVWAILRARKRK